MDDVSGTHAGTYTRKSGQKKTYQWTATWEPSKVGGIKWTTRAYLAGMPKGSCAGYAVRPIEDIEGFLRGKVASMIEGLIGFEE